MDSKAKPDVLENIKLCAERGWKCSFRFFSGENFEGAYITGTNWEAQVVSAERVNERHLPPRIIYIKDVESIEVGWI